MTNSIFRRHYIKGVSERTPVEFLSEMFNLPYKGVTLLFEHSSSPASEIDYFEIFSCLRENQLAQRFFVKFNLLLFFLIFECWECFMHMQRNTNILTVFQDKTNLYNMYKINFIKLQNVCDPYIYIDMFVKKWIFFFDGFVNNHNSIEVFSLK